LFPRRVIFFPGIIAGRAGLIYLPPLSRRSFSLDQFVLVSSFYSGKWLFPLCPREGLFGQDHSERSRQIQMQRNSGISKARQGEKFTKFGKAAGKWYIVALLITINGNKITCKVTSIIFNRVDSEEIPLAAFYFLIAGCGKMQKI
jgi:hypothetical protein